MTGKLNAINIFYEYGLDNLKENLVRFSYSATMEEDLSRMDLMYIHKQFIHLGMVATIELNNKDVKLTLEFIK